eukprot:gene4939-21279_t
MEQFVAILPEGKAVTCLEDLGTFSLKQLKQVLRRYNEKTSGVKADLVLRVYAIFCRLKENISSSSNATESSASNSSGAWTYDAIFSRNCKHLPWTSDLRGTPPFSFIQLYDYLLAHVLLVLGWGVLVIVITLVGNRKGLQQSPDPVSCTSKLSAWNVPSASTQNLNPEPIDKVVIQKIKFGKDNAKSDAPRYNLYDPRSSSDRQLDESNLEILKSKLSSLIPNSCFFGFHDKATHEQAGQNELSSPNEQLSLEIVSSLDAPYESADVELLELSDSSPFSDIYDISCNPFKEMMDIFCDNFNLTKDEVDAIEKSTGGQSSNEEWKQQRKYRITASNFYSAAVNTVEPSSKLKSMFYATFTSASTNHGNRFESHVRDLYKKTMIDQGFPINVAEVGLKVSHTEPYLAASLDGIISCRSEKWGLEIKCPFSKYNSSLDDAIKDRNFFLKQTSEGVKLKRRHKYYFQVQGEMFCANLRRVDFVVWFGDNKPLFIESIFYDEDFVLNFILPRLKFFYCRAVLPEFFTRRVQRGMKLYLQDGWESYEKKKAKK